MFSEGGFNPELAKALKKEREDVQEEADGFFPDRMTKESLAPSLNLAPEDISDEELTEIQEFAVNAGAEMVRGSRNTKSDVIFIGYHDIFHAADAMKRTHGESPVSKFVISPRPFRYIDPEIMRDEMYPLLFLKMNEHAPMPVELMTPEGRKRMKQHVREIFEIQDLPELDADIPEGDIDSLLNLYELIVKEALRVNGRRALRESESEDLQEQFEKDLDAVFSSKERPENYTEFAKRIFSGEFKENPRLFLDQFLADIRSLPNQP
jgi:hypothetical protein